MQLFLFLLEFVEFESFITRANGKLFTLLFRYHSFFSFSRRRFELFRFCYLFDLAACFPFLSHLASCFSPQILPSISRNAQFWRISDVECLLHVRRVHNYTYPLLLQTHGETTSLVFYSLNSITIVSYDVCVIVSSNLFANFPRKSIFRKQRYQRQLK